MTRLLARLRLTLEAWLFLRRWHRTTHGGWPVPPHPGAEWTPEAATALRAFLSTPTGAALIGKLREADLQTSAHAVHTGSPDTREYRCGYAGGLRAAVAYMLTLSSPPAAHAGLEPDADGADALLARLAP